MDSKRDDWSNLSLDFIRFLISALGFGVALLGYAYTHTFFRSFGLTLFQLEMSYIDILYRGVALIGTPGAVWHLLLLILFAVLLLVMRRHLPQIVGLLAALLAVMILIFFTLKTGRDLGAEHAKEIWAKGAGKKAFCRFHAKDGDPLNELLPVLERLGREERLRVIHMGKDLIYLAPKLNKLPRGHKTGESYAVPISMLRFCRIVGT